ncbi:MAG: ASCH domain-containing protein [Alphaproteobacteria bacterium]
MQLSQAEMAFWEEYASTLKIRPRGAVTASIAGDQNIADELLKLYLTGKKRAGSGLVRDYKKCNFPLPAVDAHWIVLNSEGKPACILRTAKVEVHQFDQVPAYVAEAEGEGDGSLEYWRKAHREFFEPYLEDLGVIDLEKEEVVTEFFELVYKANDPLPGQKAKGQSGKSQSGKGQKTKAK